MLKFLNKAMLNAIEGMANINTIPIKPIIAKIGFMANNPPNKPMNPVYFATLVTLPTVFRGFNANKSVDCPM